METKKRPLKILNSDDTNNPEIFEKLFGHYDAQIDMLNRRRIKKLSKAEKGATDSETLNNVFNKLNELIDALNKSELTED